VPPVLKEESSSRPEQGAHLPPRSRFHNPAAESSSCLPFSPGKLAARMYTISVEPLPGIRPPICPLDFESHPGELEGGLPG
jgi:hypothetical protein